MVIVFLTESGGRVGFYVFQNYNLYQTDSNNRRDETDSNAISSSAEVIAEILLSATVFDAEIDSLKDLEKNVTISFQRSQVGYWVLRRSAGKASNVLF